MTIVRRIILGVFTGAVLYAVGRWFIGDLKAFILIICLVLLSLILFGIMKRQKKDNNEPD